MQAHVYSAEPMPSRRSGRPGASGPARPLAVAGLCVLALVLVWVIASELPAGQLRDAAALRDFTLLGQPRVDAVANFLLKLLEPLLFTIWGALLVLVAVARQRPRVAAAVVAVMALAPLSAELLKPLLAHPHASAGGVYVGPASWPSGHSTAALALVLCVVLVAPSHLRPMLAAAGAVFAGAVGVSLLILAWHMPSDVLAGYLVAALWMALAVAVLRAADRRWPARFPI
ncbi:MAG TPA: phosphatase PAP2 family protein [Solirubrobacteraceae bacterium]|nr:phosphatase PAP2 family protein [Solirubrobacteraceae bacterium]